MIGISTLASASSNNGESFTTTDASKLETWAAKHGVQEVAFWEVADYDAPGYQYSDIFNKITS